MAKRVWLYLLVCVVVLAGMSACIADITSPTPAITSTHDPMVVYVQADSSNATAAAAVATAEFYSGQLTATVDARNVTATERAWALESTQVAANVTATEHSLGMTATAENIQATQTAETVATDRAWQMAATQRAWDITATADSASVSAYATAMSGQAASVELAVERERMINQVKATAPWIITGIAFVFALIVLSRQTRVRIIPRGQPGDAPLLLDVVDGTVHDADRSPNATTIIRATEVAKLPPPSPEVQAAVTMRDQMVDLGTRGAPVVGRRPAAARQMSKMLPIPTQVQILPTDQAMPMLKGILPAIVRDAVEADILPDEKEEK